MATEISKPNNSAALTKLGGTALESIRPIALLMAENDSTDQMISAATKAKVPAALRAIREHMKPIPGEILTTEIAGLIAWARAFNIPVGDPEVVTMGYIEALRGFPLDVIRGAFRSIRAAHKWRTLPLPGDIRVHCSAAFDDRAKVWRGLVRMKNAHPEPDEKIISPEERAEVADKLAGLAKSLRAKVPAPRTNDHSREINERMRAQLAPQIEASRTALMEGDGT